MLIGKGKRSASTSNPIIYITEDKEQNIEDLLQKWRVHTKYNVWGNGKYSGKGWWLQNEENIEKYRASAKIRWI